MKKYELDRSDLISLVEGQSPSYELMEHPLIKQCGQYSGSYGRWSWTDFSDDITESQLWEMYLKLKAS